MADEEYDSIHGPIQTQRDLWAAKCANEATLKDKSRIYFVAVCDGKTLMDIHLGYDHHSIINLANVVKQHFINSDATELTITVKKEN